MVTVNISNIFDFVDKQRVLSFQKIISKNHQALLERLEQEIIFFRMVNASKRY